MNMRYLWNIFVWFLFFIFIDLVNTRKKEEQKLDKTIKYIL